jgi:hypothetical protein
MPPTGRASLTFNEVRQLSIHSQTGAAVGRSPTRTARTSSAVADLMLV